MAAQKGTAVVAVYVPVSVNAVLVLCSVLVHRFLLVFTTVSRYIVNILAQMRRFLPASLFLSGVVVATHWEA